MGAGYTCKIYMYVSRRHFLLGGLAAPVFAAKAPPPARPNVVLVLVYELPAWMLGCYGNTEVHTPNLDRLAQTGTRFLNHFACVPAAEPGYATLVSGRTPMQLGSAGALVPADVTIEKLLRGASYLAHTAEAVAEAVQFLDQQTPGKLFVLTVRSRGLQPPYAEPAQKYREMYAQARFEQSFTADAPAANARLGKEFLADRIANLRKAAAAVSALDDDVAELVSKLNQRKLLDNTLVIFVATCGALLGRHGLWDAGRASEPVNMYEEVVATPMLWSWPGHVPAQAVRPELVSAYDLLPTICDLFAIEAPNRNLCGRSYGLLATGKPLPKKTVWHATVCAQLEGTGMAREERYKVVVRDDGKSPNELYDLTADPRERANQFDNQQYVTIRNSLASELARWKQRYSA